VAEGAAGVPILRDAGPVERVGRIQFCIDVWRRKVKPLVAMGVPGDAEDLYPALLQFDHVLLKWFDAESVFDFEVPHFTVGAFGVDHELVTVAKHPRGNSEVLDGLIVKVSQNGCGASDVHGFVVMGAGEQFDLLLVAGCAKR